MERKSFKVIEANILFLVLAIVFVTFGASVQKWNIHYGLLITEYGIILLPVILLGLLLKVDLKTALKLNPIQFKMVLRIIGISFLLIPLVATVNLIPVTILSYFDKVFIPELPVADTPLTLLGSFFIIAFSPGLCEEVLFRGLMMNAYETAYNKKIGAIVAAVLFGFFHFNLQNLFGPIIIGLVAAYLMHLTNSIYAAIVLHMTNNGIAVIVDYMSQLHIAESVDTAATTAQLNASTSELWSAISILAVISMIGILIAKYLIKGIKHDTFYYALGEPFRMKEKEYYLVGKEGSKATIISKDEAFKSASYNLHAEQEINFKQLNRLKPLRIHDVWDNNEFAIVQDPKVFAPLVGALGLYVYIMYLFLTY